MLLMGQHPNHEMLMEAGNEALQLLLDPRTALVAALDKLEFQLEQMEGGRLDEALMRNIDQSTQVLSKLIGIVEETCRIIIVYFNFIIYLKNLCHIYLSLNSKSQLYFIF